MATKIKPTPEKIRDRPLRGSVAAAWRMYRSRVRSILVATIAPLGLIVLLRWLSDDYTGDQYSLVIGLISIFNTMLLARLAVVGWHKKEAGLLTYFNGVMSRYLSGVGLMVLLVAHSVPLVAGIFFVGLVSVGQASLWWLGLIIPLCIFGIALLLHASFALFALMDDMSLGVFQALRISGRLARRYYRPLLVRALGGLGVLVALGIVIIFVGMAAAPAMQSPQTQLVVDAVLSWLFTPILFCYGATVYQKLIEAYE